MVETAISIKFIWSDFWRFLKKPIYHKPAHGFSLDLAWKLFLGFFIIRILGIILEVRGFHPLVLYFTGQELQRQEHPDYGVANLLAGALLSAPLFEETAYRWGLRFDPVRTAVSIGLIVFYWLPYGGTYSATITRVWAEPGFYLMLGMGLVAGLTAFALLRIPFIAHRAAQWWERNFGWVFYVSSLMFGLMHIFNVRGINATVVGLAFFITFQQILLGLFNGYVRMKFGFAQAIVQHALFNLVPVIIQLSRS